MSKKKKTLSAKFPDSENCFVIKLLAISYEYYLKAQNPPFVVKDEGALIKNLPFNIISTLAFAHVFVSILNFFQIFFGIY